jgi:hypothetical protein
MVFCYDVETLYREKREEKRGTEKSTTLEVVALRKGGPTLPAGYPL